MFIETGFVYEAPGGKENIAMQDEELNEIEQRISRVRPGPWEAFVFTDRNPNDQDFIRIGGFDDSFPDMEVTQFLDGAHQSVPFQDLEFIAHSRQDVPALLAEVRRLREILGDGSEPPQ